MRDTESNDIWPLWEDMIILATTSTYRIEIFQRLGLKFISEGSNVDEHTGNEPSDPRELTQYLARLKAESVARHHSTGIVIWFDSAAVFDGQIFEKPTSRAVWFERLHSMSWKIFSYYSGIYMIDTATGETLTDCVQTDCQMRRYSDSEIERYLDDGSGSYKTHTHGFDPYHGYSIAFIESIVGNPLNITGVPTSTVIEMLKRIGYPI